ncbi:mariner transposase [Trichonephila clavipes]|nr:mariner transposase [Trichonephila clavipes]
MASGYWDAHGIIFSDYFAKGKTINGKYCANSLQRLSAEIKRKQSHLYKKKVLIRQDNAAAHKSIIVMTKINELKFELLPHVTYLPDLVPLDYLLSIPKYKKMAQWSNISQRRRSDVRS